MNSNFTLYDLITGDIKQTVSSPSAEKDLYLTNGFGVIDGHWNAATHRVDIEANPPAVVPKT